MTSANLPGSRRQSLNQSGALCMKPAVCTLWSALNPTLASIAFLGSGSHSPDFMAVSLRATRNAACMTLPCGTDTSAPSQEIMQQALTWGPRVPRCCQSVHRQGSTSQRKGPQLASSSLCHALQNWIYVRHSVSKLTPATRTECVRQRRERVCTIRNALIRASWTRKGPGI